jgi:hypothetical protein
MVSMGAIGNIYIGWHTIQQPWIYTGPYRLVERQIGHDFFQYYDFLEGPDSDGSMGYNTYVGFTRAMELHLTNITPLSASLSSSSSSAAAVSRIRPTSTTSSLVSSSNDDTIAHDDAHEPDHQYSAVFIRSAPTVDGPRESIRLEGKRHFNRGLFILDIDHVPSGCGVWPAFWLVDEQHWPTNGEIDIVEPINGDDIATTSLHTTDSCTMYQHVPPFVKTGTWSVAEGVIDRYTLLPDNYSRVPADNCYGYAPHQWINQGCVAMENRHNTSGDGLNQRGGGIYVLEWDPSAGYIRSWVFPRNDKIPENLRLSLHSSSPSHTGIRRSIVPEPNQWGVLPYAYFAIGSQTGCSTNHFKNMRLVFNLAFCGSAAGNRFPVDCPRLAKQYKAKNFTADPSYACKAYIASNPQALQHAYWMIRGVYIYQRQ